MNDSIFACKNFPVHLVIIIIYIIGNVYHNRAKKLQQNLSPHSNITTCRLKKTIIVVAGLQD